MLFRELLHSVISSLSKTREEIVVDTFVIQVDIYVYIIYANLKWISIEQLVSTKQLHVHSTCILRETTRWSLKETSYFILTDRFRQLLILFTCHGYDY